MSFSFPGDYLSLFLYLSGSDRNHHSRKSLKTTGITSERI